MSRIIFHATNQERRSVKFSLNVLRSARNRLEICFSALLGLQVKRHDKISLLAQILAAIRQFADAFERSTEFPSSRVSSRQRSAAFAYDLMDFVAPDMAMAEYSQSLEKMSSAWREELTRPWPCRRAFANVTRANFFAGHEDRWRAYVTHMRRELPWFNAKTPIVEIAQRVQASFYPPLASSSLRRVRRKCLSIAANGT